MGSFASGKRSFGFCDQCGFRYPLKTLKPLIVNFVRTSTLVCKKCWNPDHPQYRLGKLKINDPQALKDPRPDTAQTESRMMQWGWNPVGGARDPVTPNDLEAAGEVGDVTITTG